MGSSIDILSSSPAALLGLLGIPGLTLLTESFRQTAATQYAISGFADDAAIAALQARGLTVNVVSTQAEMDAHQAQVLQDLANSNR